MGKDQVYVVNANGSHEIRVSDGRANNIYTSWLPDGKRVAFSSNREGGDRKFLYVVNAADGSGLTRVSDAQSFFGRWSPRGGKIAFIAGGWPRSEIYIMRKDGSRQVKLTR